MTRARPAGREPQLQDLRVLVVGAGKSGRAAARLALSHGARVAVADVRPASELEAALGELGSRLTAIHADGHPPALLEDCDLLVVSPGVPLDQELFVEARRRGVPAWGEVELAARYCRGRVVGITGSNGKSTVTAMTGGILRAAGVPGGTGGNLDMPFADLLADDADEAVHAVELSSFQLESIDLFQAAVAVILNLSPDHLDRHPSYDAYARAKARIFETQEAGDAALLNADDPESARFEPSVRGRLHRFSIAGPVEHGAFADGDDLVLRTEFGEERAAGLLGALRVPGPHNRSNALAAALAARLVGTDPAAIERGLLDYRALAHRLEPVGEIRGVSFWNDSKATNVDAASRALASFPEGRVHLVLGGKDKGADWTALEGSVRRHAKRLLLVGEAADAVAARLGGCVQTVHSVTIDRAVADGLAGAEPGDVVLLSPACASFDQYRNFEERGEDFRRAVAALAARENGRA